MDTAAQTQQYAGYDPGADEAQASNRIFVNLRIGKIAQTGNEQLAGFSPAQTKNKDESINNFFAKSYDHITGFVEDIRWHTHKLPDGTVLAGWNITVDAGEKGVFVLGVNVKDRPFQSLMNCLLNVDLTRTVRFVGFMGKNPKNDRPQKVLLLTQGMDPETKKPVWVQPAHDQRWLSRMLINKLKEKVPLTEAEEKNVSRMKDGSFNKDYPYIVQNADESWSFDAWNNFLHEQMENIVIPAVEAAAAERGNRMPPTVVPHTDIPADESFSGPVPVDDDIPF